MRNLLNPKWLLIINTLPIVILFALSYEQLSIIKTLLEENSIKLWMSFGFTLLILGILNLAYAGYLIFKQKSISVYYGIIALLCYIPFLYLLCYNLNEITPTNIPRWMLSENYLIYVGTFLMPTLAYSLFVIVAHFTPQDKEHKAWLNFLIAIGIPILGYLFSLIILPLWQPVINNYHVILILTIVATLVFLFFLVRCMFIFVTKKTDTWKKYQLAWKIPITIIFPIMGLLANQTMLFQNFYSLKDDNIGIFGNFSNAWFYILAIVNGILICLPNLNNKIYRFVLFIGRGITFIYTLYFFLVFMPFLPFSIIAIIVAGMGFLMLVPLLLFIIHINELSKDFQYLTAFFSRKLIILTLALSLSLIPTLITATYLKDKNVLNETLSYLYSPNYSKQYKINQASLKKTLIIIKHHHSHNADNIILNANTPLLSAYFNWLVLDNLTLSEAKISTINRVFFGDKSFTSFNEKMEKDSVIINNISTNSTYDTTQRAWRSWVNLEISNRSTNAWVSEYTTTFYLPEGCWISNYYLYVGKNKEFGILSEKRSAMWVFSNIRAYKKDPGILYYLSGNKVALRIFPFEQDEVRKTGIEFFHKEPIKLNIDNNIVELGKTENTVNENISTENIIYVSALQKQKLNSVQRKPYFHFLVDISKDKQCYSSDFTKRISNVLASNKEFSEKPQISFVNSYVNTIPLDSNWSQQYKRQSFEGGFYLDRAIRTTLFNAYKNKTYPIIVVVTDSIQNAILNNDFSDFKFAFPESKLFFNVNPKGLLEAHSLIGDPMEKLPDNMVYSFYNPVLEYKLPNNTIAYLPKDNEPSIILKKEIFETKDTDIKENDWNSALEIHGLWMSQVLHPETTEKGWANLIKYSFISKVMTPETSFLIVENEAQKAILKKKQKEVLSGNRLLDLSSDPVGMDEPSLWIIAILSLFIIWYRRGSKF